MLDLRIEIGPSFNGPSHDHREETGEVEVIQQGWQGVLESQSVHHKADLLEGIERDAHREGQVPEVVHVQPEHAVRHEV